MAKNKKTNDNGGRISGRNIYEDHLGQTIYRDPINKTGYVIDEKVEGQFYIYKNRYFIIPIALILFAEYFPSWVQAVVAGVLISVVVEAMFRFRFLPKLRTSKRFNVENRKTMLVTIVESNDLKKAVLRAILYIAFAILIIANAIMINADTAIMALSGVLCLGACYCALINIIAMFKMKR